MIKALLLDFNGVILDDEGIQQRIYTELLKEHDIELTEEDYMASLGMDDKTFVASAMLRGGREADFEKILELTAEKTTRWRKVIEAEMPLFAGAENFIHKTSNDLSLGIVSMSKREEIDFVLEKAGISNCFNIVVSAEDIEKCKPDPECYRLGFQILDRSRTDAGHLPMLHSECVVIEDSPPGVAAARSADLPVLGITNTVDEEALRKAGANFVGRHLDDWFTESFKLVFR
jgi:HAD superfamily hydrolase (TIGR01509 family)